MTVIFELHTQDDLASIRSEFNTLQDQRVVLVLPWEINFLSRALDYDLLRRAARRSRLEVAIVSPDPERRALAEGCGYPAFASAEVAQATEKWPVYELEDIQPPPNPWWADDPRPKAPRQVPGWVDWLSLGTRVLIFLAAVLVVALAAYAVIPHGSLTLIPAGQYFSTIVPVSVDPDAEALDLGQQIIPARWVGDEFEGYTEVETTGTMSVVSGRATGSVVFNNLLLQDYRVPAGTVVRTSSTSYPVRFRTTADVIVPAAGQASVPIEAVGQNVPNVGPYQINQVEGVAAYAVRVTNPDSTYGAEYREVRVVVQADYQRAYAQLERELLDQAYEQLSEWYLESNETLLRDSMWVVSVPKEAYTHFVTEQSDTVGLNMRLLVQGLAVDVDNAEAIAYGVLADQVPASYNLVDVQFDLGEVAEEDIGPGVYTFFVTARAYAAAALDIDEAMHLVRGQLLSQAEERLLTNLPLEEDPQMTVWPDWMQRMPLLPLRIEVEVHAQGQASEDPAGVSER